MICILGTGPSFDSALKIFRANDNNIITCNSAIYQNNLWNEKKHILCFADPVYHFGKSEEALRFKSEVIKKFNNIKFFIVCPIECFPILRDSWGIDEKYIIGLSRDSESLYRNIDNEFIDIKKPVIFLLNVCCHYRLCYQKIFFLGGLMEGKMTKKISGSIQIQQIRKLTIIKFSTLPFLKIEI